MTYQAPVAVLALLALAGCAAEPPPPPAPAPIATPVSAPAPTAAEVVSAAPATTAAPTATAAASAPPSPCPEGMAYIPGGEAVFGQYQKTKEKVSIKPFCIDVSEVTTDLYAACVKAGKCDTVRLTVCDPSTYAQPGRGNLPMICVDYPQAEKYCAAQDKRLLATEEWEWAARGASATTTRPWGEGELGDQLCWSGTAKREKPCEINSFPKGDSPQGVHDLLGGVQEWTTTKSDAHSEIRQVRGGSWKDYGKELFDVSRHGIFKTTYRCGFVGIRCGKSLP